MQRRLKAIVTGRVQGVMFRHFTQNNAKALGIVGEVKNLVDGSVEVFAEGEEASLKSLLEKLHRGPVFARVDGIKEEYLEPTGDFKSFSIVYD